MSLCQHGALPRHCGFCQRRGYFTNTKSESASSNAARTTAPPTRPLLFRERTSVRDEESENTWHSTPVSEGSMLSSRRTSVTGIGVEGKSKISKEHQSMLRHEHLLYMQKINSRPPPLGAPLIPQRQSQPRRRQQPPPSEISIEPPVSTREIGVQGEMGVEIAVQTSVINVKVEIEEEIEEKEQSVQENDDDDDGPMVVSPPTPEAPLPKAPSREAQEAYNDRQFRSETVSQLSTEKDYSDGLWIPVKHPSDATTEKDSCDGLRYSVPSLQNSLVSVHNRRLSPKRVAKKKRRSTPDNREQDPIAGLINGNKTKYWTAFLQGWDEKTAPSI